MSTVPFTPFPSVWILDACSALNLVASGHFEAIVRTPLYGQPVTYALADVVIREALSIRHGGTGDDADLREPIDWELLASQGLVRIEAPATTAENAVFVALAGQIDDGEAMTLALADSRGYGVVTDDRKARRILDTSPNLGTPEILKNWADHSGVDSSTLGLVVRAIGERARFAAPRSHTLKPWWDAALASR